jgi:hypothetical protein
MKEMKNYGLRGGMFGLKKKEAQAFISAMQANEMASPAPYTGDLPPRPQS